MVTSSRCPRISTAGITLASLPSNRKLFYRLRKPEAAASKNSGEREAIHRSRNILNGPSSSFSTSLTSALLAATHRSRSDCFAVSYVRTGPSSPIRATCRPRSRGRTHRDVLANVESIVLRKMHISKFAEDKPRTKTLCYVSLNSVLRIRESPHLTPWSLGFSQSLADLFSVKCVNIERKGICISDVRPTNGNLPTGTTGCCVT